MRLVGVSLFRENRCSVTGCCLFRISLGCREMNSPWQLERRERTFTPRRAIERGTANPTMEGLERIVYVVGVEADELFAKLDRIGG